MWWVPFALRPAFPDPTSQSGVALVRFNPDGGLATRFGGGGVVLDPRTSGGAVALAIQPDDRILVGGATLVSGTTGTIHRGFVERFNTDGTPDTDFANSGVSAVPTGWTLQYVTGLAVDPSQGFFISGFQTGASNLAVAHLTTSGQLGPSFGSGGVASTRVGTNGEALYGVSGPAIDPDRGLVIVAHTTPSAGPLSYGERAVVTRFDFQSNLDPTFNHSSVEFVDYQPPSATLTDSARAVAVQPDGKVLVAGDTLGRGQRALALARLNVDGTRETSFGIGGEAVTPFLSSHGHPLDHLASNAAPETSISHGRIALHVKPKPNHKPKSRRTVAAADPRRPNWAAWASRKELQRTRSGGSD